MKKFIIIFSSLILIVFAIIGVVKMQDKKEEDLTKIRVAEVTHSVFYAPWYVALEKGYFKEEGLDIEVILTPGADKVAAAVLSNDVEIGFCGPESTIYVYNGGEKDFIQSFAGLTKRDGQFIVAREKMENFSIEDLYGKEVLVGRKAGMPALNFINAVNNSGSDLNKINLNYTIEFASLSGAFIGGTGDFVNLFEPNATKLESTGLGYIVGSIGMLSGEVPYTAFNARKSYIENNKETIDKFTRALNKGLTFVKENSDEEVAKTILKQFPDSSLNEITTIVKNYRDADSWLDTTYISEESFVHLQDIMKSDNLIDDYVSYNDLINNACCE